MAQLAAYTADPRPSTPLVRCRTSSLWLLAGLLVLLGGFFSLPAVLRPGSDCQCTPQQLHDELLFKRFYGGIGLIIIAFGAWTALWAIRGTIIGDQHGLRWRGAGRWRVVSWHAVTDYYLEMMPSGRQIPVVKTPAGTLRLTSTVSNRIALSDLVAARSTSAPAREWGAEGLRAVDTGDYEFQYKSGENKFISVLFWLFWPLLYFWIAHCLLPNFNLWQAVRRDGWGFVLAGLGLVGMVVLAKTSVILCALPLMRDTRRRQHQRLVLNQWGIRFTDGATIIAAPWSDVIGYRAEAAGRLQFARRYVIETKAGSFDVRHTIRRFALLKALVEHYTPAPHGTGWEDEDSVPAGGAGAGWTGGAPGLGDRIFHYRTHAYRTMLALPIAFNVVLLLMPFIPRPEDADHPTEVTFLVGMNIVYLAFTFGCFRAYYRTQIEVGSAGIVGKSFFRQRFIPWGEVIDYGLRSGSANHYFVQGGGQTIYFSGGMVNCPDLLREIEIRSVNCKVHRWERD